MLSVKSSKRIFVLSLTLVLVFLLVGSQVSKANDYMQDNSHWANTNLQSENDILEFLSTESSVREEEKVEFLLKAFKAAKENSFNSLACRLGMDLSSILDDSQSLVSRYKYLNEVEKSGYCQSSDELGALYNSIGNFFFDLGKYEDALKAYFKSVDHYKELNRNLETIPLGRISEVYYKLNDIKKAISFSKKAIPFSEKCESPDREYYLAYDYFRLMKIFASKGNMTKAEDNYKKSLEFLKKLDGEKYNKEYFKIYTSATELFLEKGLKAKAKQSLSAASAYINDSNRETYKYYEAKIAFEYINYDKAFRLVKEIDANKIESFTERKNFLEFKKSIMVVIANLDQALEISEEIRNIEKEHYDKRSAKTFAMADVEYELLKNQEKIEVLNRQRELDKSTIKKQKTSTFAIISLAFLLLSLVISLLLQNKQKRKTIQAELGLKQVLIQKNVEIEKSRQDALSASQAKQDFLSTMSHEIRTPMNAVLGLTNLLLDEMPRGDQLKHLQNIKFSGENLLSIINDTLDFSKIESGKLTLHKDEFDLKKLLDNTIAAVRYSRDKNELEVLQKQKLEKLDTLVIGDRTRLNQVLINILGNAIKFTEEGYVSLESSILKDTDSTYLIEFKIRDTGIGIPAEKLDSIFDSFVQVENDKQESLKGTGLGLAITKKLIEKQGGKIEVESKEGMGCVFTFSLPFEKGKDYTAMKVIKTDEQIYQEGLEGLRVLLVEDNHINQIVAVNTLKKLKVITTVAENGVEALEIYSKNVFDLVLMDIQMPLMNGIEATTRIRALEDPDKNSIPIIALSADAYSNNVKVAFEAGMNAYLTKPFKPKDLFDTIRENLQRRQRAGA